MDLVVARAAGLDGHKQTVVTTVQTPERRETRPFGTMTADLAGLAAWLRAQAVTPVVLESTGSFWLPVYNSLERVQPACELVVVNAQHVKQVPGRKTDGRDSEWLCDLLRHGLLRASFIPDRAHRERRELARYRQALIRERAKEVNRVQKLLEGANLKLAAAATDLLGVSGRQMLEALVAGTTAPQALAALAKGKLQRKREALEQALSGLVGEHQRFVLREQLGHIDDLDTRIARLRPFAAAQAALDTIPGVGQPTAAVLLAALGADLSRFPSAAHLASWAGLCPGNHESAGKRPSGRTGKGNPRLREALVEAAWATARTKHSYLSAHSHRLATRRGAKRALVAVAHTLLVIVYHVLTTGEVYHVLTTGEVYHVLTTGEVYHVLGAGEVYHVLGADYFDQRNKDALARRLVQRLSTLGYTVALEPAAA